MRDPYVHAEKTSLPGFGHQVIRALLTDALGVAPDLPKTTGTGCGLRRPLASTSTVPEEITCLACRAADNRTHAWRAARRTQAASVLPEPSEEARHA